MHGPTPDPAVSSIVVETGDDFIDASANVTEQWEFPTFLTSDDFRAADPAAACAHLPFVPIDDAPVFDDPAARTPESPVVSPQPTRQPPPPPAFHPFIPAVTHSLPHTHAHAHAHPHQAHNHTLPCQPQNHHLHQPPHVQLLPPPAPPLPSSVRPPAAQSFDVHIVAPKILADPSPVGALDRHLHFFYKDEIARRNAAAPSVPRRHATTPSAVRQAQLEARRRSNSITSAACAQKKKYGVGLMEHITTVVAADVARLVSSAVDAGRRDLAARARELAVSPDMRKERIRHRVEAAAELARREKVAQKTDAEISAAATAAAATAAVAVAPNAASTSAVARGAAGVVKDPMKESKRRAQNCATAHKNNRVKKGMFDEYREETKLLVELRARMHEVIRTSAMNWGYGDPRLDEGDGHVAYVMRSSFGDGEAVRAIGRAAPAV